MEQANKLKAGNYGLIAGISILMMVLTVPIAEFGIFPKLFTEGTGNIAATLRANQTLFTVGILLNFITVLCDIVAAWALYIFLSPVNKSFSLLVAWFRVLFAALYLVALYNLIQVVTLLNSENIVQSIEKSQVSDQLIFYFHSYKAGWSFALILFGIYLMLLGALVIRANFVPKIFGILLLMAGIGYFIDSLGKFLLPGINTEFLTITFLGELAFMGWLLIKGRKASVLISI